MDFYTYKGISAGKYIEGEIEALNQEEASHKLKAEKVIITNLVRSKKKKLKEKKIKRVAVFHLVKKKFHLKM
jgi:type IV pilus assembly protein PilC